MIVYDGHNTTWSDRYGWQRKETDFYVTLSDPATGERITPPANDWNELLYPPEKNSARCKIPVAPRNIQAGELLVWEGQVYQALSKIQAGYVLSVCKATGLSMPILFHK